MTALAVTALAAVATPAAFADVARTGAGTPYDPDALGGDLIFNSGLGDQLAKDGFFGMVYLYPNIKDSTSCDNLVANWPEQDVRLFRKDDKLNPIFRKEERQFRPTEASFPLYPKMIKEYEVTESKTQSWEHSPGVSFTLGTGDKARLKKEVTLSYQFTYKVEVTTTRGEKTIINNVTNDKVQFYQYGITHDVFAMQVTPWLGAWLKKGDPVHVGNDQESVARWYEVKQDGCYRVGEFTGFSYPRKAELTPVGEMHKKDYDAGLALQQTCPVIVNGDNVRPEKQIQLEGQQVSYEPDTETEALQNGTCVKLQPNEWEESTGDIYYKTNLNASNGDPLWLNEHDLEFLDPAAEMQAKPLPKLGDGAVVTLSPVVEPKVGIGWDGTYVGLFSIEGNQAFQWKLVASKEPGYWQFHNVQNPTRCMDVDENSSIIGSEPCTGHVDQDFRFIHAGDDEYYIQERRGSGTY